MTSSIGKIESQGSPKDLFGRCFIYREEQGTYGGGGGDDILLRTDAVKLALLFAVEGRPTLA
jgi:hypothetical protein